MIEGVKIKTLRVVPDERGMVKLMLRNDDPEFKKFGEIYFSFVFPGVVKGWRLHRKMTLNYAAIQGKIKLVLYDDRTDSSTRGKLMEIMSGEDKYELITIPPGIWNAFKGMGSEISIIANLSDIPHSSNEIRRMNLKKNTIFAYNWSE